jgi:hypothetical protein
MLEPLWVWLFVVCLSLLSSIFIFIVIARSFQGGIIFYLGPVKSSAKGSHRYMEDLKLEVGNHCVVNSLLKKCRYRDKCNMPTQTDP